MVRVAALITAMAAVSMSGQETVTYGYDAHGRLVEASHVGGVNDGAETVYDYDDADNRTSKTTTGAGSLLAAPAGERHDADTAASDDATSQTDPPAEPAPVTPPPADRR